jgi:hypothetical protein
MSQFHIVHMDHGQFFAMSHGVRTSVVGTREQAICAARAKWGANTSESAASKAKASHGPVAPAPSARAAKALSPSEVARVIAESQRKLASANAAAARAASRVEALDAALLGYEAKATVTLEGNVQKCSALRARRIK